MKHLFEVSRSTYLTCHLAQKQKLNDGYIAKVQGEYDMKPLHYLWCDGNICQNHQVYNFVEIPSFVSLFTRNITEPLYFVKLVEKSAATEGLKYAFGHVMRAGELFLKENYFKTRRYCTMNHKQFKVIPTTVVLEPVEVSDTYKTFMIHKTFYFLFHKPISLTLFFW